MDTGGGEGGGGGGGGGGGSEKKKRKKSGSVEPASPKKGRLEPPPLEATGKHRLQANFIKMHSFKEEQVTAPLHDGTEAAMERGRARGRRRRARESEGGGGSKRVRREDERMGRWKERGRATWRKKSVGESAATSERCRTITMSRYVRETLTSRTHQKAHAWDQKTTTQRLQMIVEIPAIGRRKETGSER